MPIEVKIWKIHDQEQLIEMNKSKLNLEERIETWLENDISILSSELLVIGRQVETAFGGFIDLLCLDKKGDAVVVELKRDKTPRDITSQTIDYASWVRDLSNDKITEISDKYLGDNGPLENAFKKQFGEELPEILNQEHSMLIVASEIDASTERIVSYLSDTYGVDINGATFQYFKDDNGDEFLARVFLIEPSEVEYKSQTKSASKRKPNLTYEELSEIAEKNGIDIIYNTLVEGLAKYFDGARTTRSSIAFVGKLDNSTNAIFNMIPKDSSNENGLKFQVYINRLSTFLNIGKDELIHLLPPNKKEWQYVKGYPEEWSGYEGYFESIADVERLLNGLKGILNK